MMKNLYCKIVSIVCSALTIGCGYNDFNPETTLSEVYIPLQIPISQLKSLYHGETYYINDDLVLTAYVSSSDKHGNFSRVLYVADGTDGLMIMTGLYDTHTNYKPGIMVHIKLKGLALDSYHNTFRIGRMSDNNYVTYIGNSVLLDDIIIRDSRTRTSPPREVTIGELTTDDAGSLVTIANLTADILPGQSWADEWPGYGSIYTNIRFVAPDGSDIYVSTNSYADFASDAIPTGAVNITGIVVCEEVNNKETLMLRISSPQDVITVTQP